MKNIALCLLTFAAFGVFAGCQSQNTTSTKKTGSYTAARRNTIGSHIPQPYSADSSNSTVDQDAYLREQERGNNTNSAIGRGGIGVGGGGR